MKARSATFIASAPTAASFPPPGAPEIAFAGRSNVGKSSLLNVVCGVNQLARTSSTPGRTRALNWFAVVPPKGPDLAFVDLPGFGYAKVPHDMRDSWRPLIANFVERPSLKLFIVLVDLRRGPEKEEAELFDWLDQLGIPSLLVLTKADKLSKSQRNLAAREHGKVLRRPSPALTFSALSGDGVPELWRAIMSKV